MNEADESVIAVMDALYEPITLPKYFLDYKIVSCLKNTNNTAVYLVQKQEVRYILKKFYDGENESVLKNEYEILRALDLAFLPKAFDFFQDDDGSWLLREYAEGMTLADTVERFGVMPERAAADVMLKLCAALKELHSLSSPVIHRDVKPQNIVIRADDELMLIDMGTARTLKQNASNDTTVMGTDAIAAPEQFGYAQTDERTDIYSAGLLLAFLLTGDYNAKKADISRVSHRMRKIIKTCSSFDPDRRFQNIRELEKSLIAAKTLKKRTFTYTAVIAAIICITVTGIALALNIMNKLPISDEPVDTPTFEKSETQYTITLDGVGEGAFIVKFNGSANDYNEAMDKVRAGELDFWEFNERSYSDATDLFNEGDIVNVNAGMKPGYTFDGWMIVNPNGLDFVDYDFSFPEFLFEMPASNVKLTAKWLTSAPVVFTEPLIEKAARNILGFDDKRIIYENDLLKVTSMLIIGDECVEYTTHFFKGWQDDDILRDARLRRGRLGGISSLEDIRYFKNIRKLGFVGQNITDLSPLAGLPLEVLWLAVTPVEDISPLRDCLTLSELYFDCTNVADISAVAGLKNLSRVALDYMDVTDLSPLKDLPLTELHLEGIQTGRNYAMIAGMPLQKLFTTRLDMNQLDEVCKIKSLEFIFCTDMIAADGFEQFDGFERFDGMPVLKCLIMLACGITNLDGAEKIPNLEELDFGAAPFEERIIDIAPLTKAPKLKKISMRDVEMTDYSLLLAIPNLEAVEIRARQAEKFYEKIPNPPFKVELRD